MTARNRSRTFLVGAAVAALLAPLALVAALATPASATTGGKPHDVYIYKVEQHFTMSGEFPDQYLHEHVFCNPGDIALDGMWRIDHVDQAQPPEFLGDERDVFVTASYGDPGIPEKWHFRIHNYADGDAQIKLWATCIRGTVEQAYGHTHNVIVTNLVTDSTHDALPADVEPSTTDFDYNSSCPAGSIAVAPGFNINMSGVSEDDHKIRLVGSWPFDNNWRSWHWSFIVTDPGADIDLYLRCLQIKTSSFGAPKAHAHNLMWAFRPNSASPWDGDHQFLSNLSTTQERRINCDDGSGGASFQDYKAAVAGFIIKKPWHVWFLGMDPRPKQRAYKFWYQSGDPDVFLGAICIRSRTSKQVAP